MTKDTVVSVAVVIAGAVGLALDELFSRVDKKAPYPVDPPPVPRLPAPSPGPPPGIVLPD